MTVLAVILAAMVLLTTAVTITAAYRGARQHIADLEEVIRAQAAELDALTIGGLHVDTATGAHDRLAIRDDIRDVIRGYCEGMWRAGDQS